MDFVLIVNKKISLKFQKKHLLREEKTYETETHRTDRKGSPKDVTEKI